jgi:hypothetical protein
VAVFLGCVTLCRLSISTWKVSVRPGLAGKSYSELSKGGVVLTTIPAKRLKTRKDFVPIGS